MPDPSRGEALDWDDADLDALAQITPADIKASQARWRADAPKPLRELLDAQPEEPDA